MLEVLIYRTNRVHPHEELPTLVVVNVDHVVEFFAADTVGDVLHVAESVHYRTLLSAQQQAIEICIYNCGSQTFKFGNKLKGNIILFNMI